jgi:LPS export ABC transporter protein LptC
MRPLYLFLFACVIFFSCKNDLDSTQKVNNNLPPRSEFGEQINVYYTEKGRQTAHLYAPSMLKQDDSLYKTYFPKGIVLKIYDSVGNHTSTLTAKYGEHDHTTNEMKAKDSAVLVGSDNKSLRANELIWLANTNQMISYGAVQIQTKDELILGDTLFADENLKRYTIKKVRGIVHVSK